jgi:hypothetical protein
VNGAERRPVPLAAASFANVREENRAVQAGAFIAGDCPERFFNNFPEISAGSSKKPLDL